MTKAYLAGLIVRNVFFAACALIAAASGIEQSWRYGALGEALAGQSYPNCPTPEQIAERAAQ
jgi:hypothetical protein